MLILAIFTILLFVSLLLFSSGLEEDTLSGQLLGCPLLSSLVKKFKTYSVSVSYHLSYMYL